MKGILAEPRIGLVAVLVLASVRAVAGSDGAHPPPAAKPLQEAVLGERSLLNINNFSLWFRRDGWSGRNPRTNNSGVTFPRSTGQVVFQDGLVWGGRVLDGGSQSVRVGGQTFSAGTVPGRILSRGVAEDPADPGVRIYRVRRDYAGADLRQDAAELYGKNLEEVDDGGRGTPARPLRQGLAGVALAQGGAIFRPRRQRGLRPLRGRALLSPCRLPPRPGAVLQPRRPGGLVRGQRSGSRCHLLALRVRAHRPGGADHPVGLRPHRPPGRRRIAEVPGHIQGHRGYA